MTNRIRSPRKPLVNVISEVSQNVITITQCSVLICCISILLRCCTIGRSTLPRGTQFESTARVTGGFLDILVRMKVRKRQQTSSPLHDGHVHSDREEATLHLNSLPTREMDGKHGLQNQHLLRAEGGRCERFQAYSSSRLSSWTWCNHLGFGVGAVQTC